MPAFPFLDSPTPVAFAHRGAAAAGPAAGLENSMAAFEHAVRLGYRYLETDVRISGDGVLVAFHDASLDRVTGRPGKISELSWAELSRARIGGVEPIVRLEDVLTAWPEVRINLDVKTSAAVPALAEALHRTGTVDRVCVGAFSDARIAHVRARVGPRLATSLGPRAVLALRMASLAPNGRVPARPAAWHPEQDGRLGACVQVPPRVGAVVVIDHRFIAAAHRRGLPVHAWTINDPAEMVRLLDLGVDGIMTDRAGVLRDLLLARGEWNAGSA